MKEFIDNWKESGLKYAWKKDFELTRERHPRAVEVFDLYRHKPSKAIIPLISSSMALAMTSTGLDSFVGGDLVGLAGILGGKGASIFGYMHICMDLEISYLDPENPKNKNIENV